MMRNARYPESKPIPNQRFSKINIDTLFTRNTPSQSVIGGEPVPDGGLVVGLYLGVLASQGRSKAEGARGGRNGMVRDTGFEPVTPTVSR